MINTRGDHIRFLFSQFRQEETVILQLYFLSDIRHKNSPIRTRFWLDDEFSRLFTQVEEFIYQRASSLFTHIKNHIKPAGSVHIHK